MQYSMQSFKSEARPPPSEYILIRQTYNREAIWYNIDKNVPGTYWTGNDIDFYINLAVLRNRFACLKQNKAW